MKKVLSLLMMTLLCTMAFAAEVTDVITVADIGNGGQSQYLNWSGLSFTSDAVYAGMTSGGNGAANANIQLRTNNDNSGIVTTTSGGKVKSVKITFNSQTTSNKTVLVFGKNTAYNAASDLYDASTKGTQLGSVIGKDGEVKTLDVDGDYEYIGIRSSNGTVYLDKIEVVWTVEDDEPEDPSITFNPAGGTYTEAQNVTITAENVPDGAFLQYNFVGESETGWVRGDTYNVTESGELKARLVKYNDTDVEVVYGPVTETYVINIPEPLKITFNPAAGEVEAGTQVTITAANVPAGMKAFARQDEGSWSKYIMSYTINQASTLQVVVVDENTDDTEISWYQVPADMKAEASYTIAAVTPPAEPTVVFNPAAGEYEAGTVVTVTVENCDFDYMLKGTYLDEEKEGMTLTFTLTETGTIMAQIWEFKESLDDYVQTNFSGSARYTVVAPEPDPVITLDPNGGEFNNEATVTVTVENMPNDATLEYDFLDDVEENSLYSMYLQNNTVKVTSSGYLVVRVVREADDDGAAYGPAKAPATGTLAELRSAYFKINQTGTGIEALTTGKAVKSIRYFNVAGQEAAEAFQGVNIVVVNYQDGTKAVTKVVK